MGSFENTFTANLLSHGSGMYKITYDSLSTSVHPLKSAFKIYPNPEADWITIYTESLEDQIDKIELINSAGSVVKSQKFTGMSNEQSRINISALENGFYFLNVSVIAKQKNYKIPVQH